MADLVSRGTRDGIKAGGLSDDLKRLRQLGRHATQRVGDCNNPEQGVPEVGHDGSRSKRVLNLAKN